MMLGRKEGREGREGREEGGKERNGDSSGGRV